MGACDRVLRQQDREVGIGSDAKHSVLHGSADNHDINQKNGERFRPEAGHRAQGQTRARAQRVDEKLVVGHERESVRETTGERERERDRYNNTDFLENVMSIVWLREGP